MRANASLPPSRVTEKLAARNGPRHSVYWVQQKKKTKSADTRLPTHANVLDATGMGGSAASRVEYTLVGKYTGEWKDGVKHGYGVLVYANGSKYEGDWRDGLRDGKGVYWVTQDAKKHSKQGTNKPKTTAAKLRKQYAGEWASDKRHGLGTFYYDDGSRYEGYYVHNRRDGDGRMVYAADQSVYEGQWSANVRSGRGTLTLANGDVYDGYWLHDKKEGPGRFYYKASGKMYDGEWVDNAPQCGTYVDTADHGSAAASQFNHDASNPLSRLHRFELPELALANAEHVVSESIARIRQERVLEHAFDAATLHDDATAINAADDDANDVDTHGETSVVFDERTMRLIQHQFTAIELAQAAAAAADGDDDDDVASSNRKLRKQGCVRCAALPQLIGTIGLRVSAAHVQLFLDELGATHDTLVSFAECVDMLSLLAESTMGDDDHGDDSDRDDEQEDDEDDDDEEEER